MILIVFNLSENGKNEIFIGIARKKRITGKRVKVAEKKIRKRLNADVNICGQTGNVCNKVQRKPGPKGANIVYCTISCPFRIVITGRWILC